MPTFDYTVSVDTATQEEANRVIAVIIHDAQQHVAVSRVEAQLIYLEQLKRPGSGYRVDNAVSVHVGKITHAF